MESMCALMVSSSFFSPAAPFAIFLSLSCRVMVSVRASAAAASSLRLDVTANTAMVAICLHTRMRLPDRCLSHGTSVMLNRDSSYRHSVRSATTVSCVQN